MKEFSHSLHLERNFQETTRNVKPHRIGFWRGHTLHFISPLDVGAAEVVYCRWELELKVAPRTKFYVSALIIAIFGVMSFDILFENEGPYSELIFFGSLLIGNVLLFLIKCPSCGSFVAYQGKIGGIPLYAGHVRKKCVCCGYDLGKV